MKNRFTTIRAKQTVAMLLISIIGMTLVALICYRIARRVILTETLNELTQAAGWESEKIDGWLAKQKTILETTGVNIQTIDDYEQIKPLIQGVIAENPDISNIIVGLETDEGIFAKDSANAAFKATERPWYILAAQRPGETILSGPYRGAVSQLMMVTFAQDIGAIDGTKSVISLDVPVANLLDAVSQISIHQGQNYAFLADQEGRIIAHPETALLPEDDHFVTMDDHPVYASVFPLEKMNEPIKLVDYDGVTRYMAASPVNEVGWVLYIAVPEESIYQAINASIPRIILISLGIMAVAVIFIHRVIRSQIVKPLQTLSAHTKEIVNGNFDISLRQNRRDEIGMLMNDFAAVADSINMVIQDMNTMSLQHQENNLDFRLDESKYKGTYREVVKGINGMVSVYVNNLTDIMGLLESFGKGDFQAPAKQYPGKLAAGNESIENFRANLIRVNKEIQTLAENALLGHLSVKADTDGLDGDWLKMIEGLNAVLEAIMTPIQESAVILEALSKGNLHMQMTGDYQGDFALIKNGLNTTIDSLSVYIREISNVLSNIAGNNLNITITTEFAGEFVAIKNSINTIIKNQNKIIKEILLTAEQVNLGAKVVAETSTNTTTGTLKQNEAIDQLNRLVEFVNNQTRKNTENAQAADELSHKAVENASGGTGEMQKMVQSMNEIKNSSDNIANVINVINDIAFQTNLLALNAAVEAARAGNSGKGFAVVADEVRNLSLRSQTAAKESQVFIEEVLEKINDGTKTAHSTASALDEIVTNITNVSAHASDIYQSSCEQSRLMGEISENIGYITRAAHDVSTSSESSSVAAEELHSQSESLNQLLNQFQIKEKDSR